MRFTQTVPAVNAIRPDSNSNSGPRRRRRRRIRRRRFRRGSNT
jgi:hypothetical protein